MTPLSYLAFWFIKNYKEQGIDSLYAQKLASTCLGVDNVLKNIFPTRDAYLDNFLSFNSFTSLAESVNVRDEFFNHVIDQVYFIKFPIERNKLVKMWNLKPKGIYPSRRL